MGSTNGGAPFPEVVSIYWESFHFLHFGTASLLLDRIDTGCAASSSSLPYPKRSKSST
jgi:hypothetical protein